jgi:hypothetical protein
MPELAHGEWEHLFEPWFANDPPRSPAVKTQGKGSESIFDEASQPLAVRRQDYVRRQPIGRAAELRSVHVGAEVERLVAYVERRHLGVEHSAAADRVELPPLRDAPLRRPEGPMPVVQPWPARNRSSGDHFADANARRSDAPLSARLPGGAAFRWVLAFASIALVALYVGYVQRSAAEAMTRAASAERTAAQVQQSAHDAAATAADRAERAVAEALTHAARAERMIEVMAAPDARRIELAGRAVAPGAVGRAFYSQSRGVIVSATGIAPPQQQDQVYQVWAATPTALVSLGLASPDAQGRIAAAYDVPAALAGSIRRFLVTLEPAGGSSRPTGQVALSN